MTSYLRMIPAALFVIGLQPAAALAAPGFETRVEFPQNTALNVYGTGSAVFNGDNRALANVAELRIEARPPAVPTFLVNSYSYVTDTYTLNGPPGTTVPVTLVLDVDYQIIPGAGNYGSRIFTSMTYPPHPGPIPSQEYRQDLSASLGYRTSGDPNIDINYVENWTVGESKEIRWGLFTWTTLNVHVDAGSTAHIEFIVPKGYSITSALGWPGVVSTEAATWSGIKSLYGR